jgi:hypothetical protein
LLGVYTPDEAAEMRDVTPVQTSGLAAKLAEQATPSEGFNPGVVDAAMAEPVADAEFSERVAEVAEAIGEALAKPVPEPVEEAVSEPETPATVETIVADASNVLLADITDDASALAWANAFMAFGLKKKSAPELMAMWTFHFEGRLAELKTKFPKVYESLYAWMDNRMAKLREPKT